MSQVHAQATPRTRAEINEFSSSLGALTERCNVSLATARKWKLRISAIVDACFNLIVDGVSEPSWTRREYAQANL